VLTKISVRKLVAAHLDTLVDNRAVASDGGAKAPRSAGDLALFFGLPALAGIAFGIWAAAIGDGAVTATITAFSIFAGLLFNLLALTYEIMRRVADTADSRRTSEFLEKKKALRQVHANVSFAILVALVIVLLCLPDYVLPDRSVASHILNGVIVFLILNFALTLLMVLKRMHLLLDFEVEHA